MAEIVGLISAIGTIVTAFYKITLAVDKVRDDFGAAASSVRAVAADTAFVAVILGQIRDKVSIKHPVDPKTARLLDETLARCRADIQDIEQSLLPLISRIRAGKPMSKRQRLRWLFAKSKICSQQATLASLKLTLSLFINTLQLEDGYHVEETKEEILDSISRAKETKTAFLAAERVDQAAAKAYEKETDDDEDSTGQSSPSSASALALERVDSQTSLSISLCLSPPDCDAAGLQLQRLNMSDLDVMQTISDDSFIKIAAHMQLQKSMTAFAVGVMDQPGDDASYPTTSDDGFAGREGDETEASADGPPSDGRRSVGFDANSPADLPRQGGDSQPGQGSDQSHSDSEDGKRPELYTVPDRKSGPPPSRRPYYRHELEKSRSRERSRSPGDIAAMERELARFKAEERRKEEEAKKRELMQEVRQYKQEALEQQAKALQAEEEARKLAERAREVLEAEQKREAERREREFQERARLEARMEIERDLEEDREKLRAQMRAASGQSSGWKRIFAALGLGR